MMKLSVLPDDRLAADAVAAEIARLVAEKPNAVLGLATGGTMEPVYDALVRAHRNGLSFRDVTTFNLDEYVGLGPDHPRSYRRYMAEQFFDRVDIDPARTHVPRGDLPPDRAAALYEAALDRAKPIDLQLLGIGRNGHIGFNEPGSAFTSRTRPVGLAPSTIEANRRFFAQGETVPDHAVTMGIGSILDARRIVLLAVTDAKAGAVAAMLEGPSGPDVPATALRQHDDVSVFLDAAAASGLRTTADAAPGRP